MKELKYFPYGSVVSIKGSKSKLMIVGVLVESNGKIYDYYAMRLPKGFQKMQDLVLFDHKDIEKLYHRGYADKLIAEYYEDVDWVRRNRDGE